ncbi:7292_t:CDS:1, partial [Paraglomus occultum]
ARTLKQLHKSFYEETSGDYLPKELLQARQNIDSEARTLKITTQLFQIEDLFNT